MTGTDTFYNSQSAKLARLTLDHGMPAIYQYREFVAAGGLMSYLRVARSNQTILGQTKPFCRWPAILSCQC